MNGFLVIRYLREELLFDLSVGACRSFGVLSAKNLVSVND